VLVPLTDAVDRTIATLSTLLQDDPQPVGA
jgi:hypothetical protein